MPGDARPGVVFDCMIYLQAAISARGPAHALIQAAEVLAVRLYVSQDVLAEVLDVLTWPPSRRRFPHLTEARVRGFLAQIPEYAVLVDDVPHVFEYPRDPKDEKYVDLALAAGARYLVSRDKDLLDLMEDEDFLRRFPGLTVLDPVAFLHVLCETAGPEPPV